MGLFRRKPLDHGGHIHPPDHFCGSNCPMYSGRHVEPLRELSAGVPPGDPYIVKAANDNQLGVTLNVGDTILIDNDGTIRNTHGSRLGRLAAQK